ncbi:PstS ABC-type phosphate transport system, periplasmic component [uncultured Caudovirales phage]|uniref:PstS ABC-type phosphate transport system, periplasmic component n=1 Tax=uncultured Caudovirales phage TaxID=2100421 RepID=A0A6J5P653_9CAUD|nr:PstS ABC-type phosphate transport system, periplasmic component [uncultured Caudovirales phage]
MRNILIAIFSLFTISASAAEVIGAGATFPYPLYSKWADEWQKQTGNKLNYQSIGSGAGINQIQTKTVTFGASDMPLTEDVLQKHNMFQFPTVIGGNVIVFNLDGIKDGELNLNDSILVDIYLGKIKKWNDESLKKLNPNLNLPNTNITVVRRSDGSGTTYIFTKYLSTISKEWESKVGTGTAIEWPVGIGAKGNEGVAGNVKQTKNSIGYVEYSYAKQNNISITTLNGISANLKSFQNSTWPITAPTYIIMHRNPSNAQQQKTAFEFFKWAFSNGDKIATDLDYVPLSVEEKNKIIKLFGE